MSLLPALVRVVFPKLAVFWNCPVVTKEPSGRVETP
jgi:hypothetical protein